MAWERTEEFLLESAWIRCVEGPRRVGGAWRKVSVCVQCRASEVVVGRKAGNSYLPGREDTMITKVGFPRARLIHCTPDVLTPAISPNVGNSTA